MSYRPHDNRAAALAHPSWWFRRDATIATMVVSSLMLGLVVAVYPEGNSVDVLIPEDGSRLSNLQVMVPSGNSDSGVVDLPEIGLPNDESRWDPKQTPARRVLAVIGLYRGAPIVLGFLLPQVNQISFDRQNFRVFRHASDFYTTIDGQGNLEVRHPSGTRLHIGAVPAGEDLTGQDVDQQWSITKNTATTPNVRLVVANGGEVKTTLDIAPSGNITLTTVGTTQVQSTGDVSIQTDGSATIQAPTINLDGDVTVSGNLSVDGDVSADGDVTAGSVSLMNHVHGGVDTGGGQTSPPV